MREDDWHFHLKLDDRNRVVPVEDPIEWARWMRDNAKRRCVAIDVFDDGRYLSTVFLGVNYNMISGEPLCFETMLFPETKLIGRSFTWEAAEQLHFEALEEIKRGEL